MKTPPGVDPEVFESALSQWRETIGEQWVFTGDADLDLYRDAYTPFRNEETEIVVAAALAPETAEQVQQIMRVANRHKIPIYPISTGRNLAYGGSAPVLSGSVVLDLKRLNRILEVNERNAYVLLEPGVSYFDLYRHLRDNGYKLWIDCPDPGWGSLIGNSLEHGAGYTVAPHRDHFDSHCGMEIVLANGEIVRTGMGALPGSETWQQFKYGFGPTVDGLFAQSNFGVVTKMGFWLFPEPETFLDAVVTAPRHDDIIPLVDITASLTYSGVMNSNMLLGSPMRDAAMFDPDLRELFLHTDQAEVRGKLDDYATSHKLAFWTSRLKFYGPEKVVTAQWEHARERFSSIPGVGFQEGELLRFPLSEDQIAGMGDQVAIGVPNLKIFGAISRSTFNPTPTMGHIGFSPIIPMTGEAVIESHRVIWQTFADFGTTPAFMTMPVSYHSRTFIILIAFSIVDDPAINRKTREVFRRLIKVAAEHGWGEYRTHTAFMDDCAAVYSYNNHSLRRLHETLKDAIDPNGILSAGRYGIWPGHLRKN